MIIDCIADLHGFVPELDKGDLLIVAGDLTSTDEPQQHFAMWDWLCNQNYKKIIVIAGNHDNFLQSLEGDEIISQWSKRITYLCDSGTEYIEYKQYDPPIKDDFYTKTYKIWGSPWTKTFEGMNSKCKAFTLDTDEELEEKWRLIPNDIDILITHSPPYDILDEVDSQEHCTSYHVGSRSLLKRVCEIKPKLHVFGHIHEGYGDIFAEWDSPITTFVNASHVNEYYEPVNKPIRVII